MTRAGGKTILQLPQFLNQCGERIPPATSDTQGHRLAPHLFHRLFTVEEAKKIRNITFHEVLTAVTSASPELLQPHVFTWSEGESFVQQQGVGEGSKPILVTQPVTQ